MAKIPKPTGASLLTAATDPTIEAWLYAIVIEVQSIEADKKKNPSSYDFFQSSLRQDAPTAVQVAASIPVSPGVGNLGEGTFVASADLYKNTGFSPGTGGLFKARDILQAFIEVIVTIDKAQKDPDKNRFGRTNVQWNLSPEGADKRFIAQATVPVKITNLPEGGTQEQAIEWLDGSF